MFPQVKTQFSLSQRNFLVTETHLTVAPLMKNWNPRKLLTLVHIHFITSYNYHDGVGKRWHLVKKYQNTRSYYSNNQMKFWPKVGPGNK